MTTAHEAATTYNCKFPGCPNEASAMRGPYSYCVEHRDRAARGLPPTTSNRNPSTARSGLAAAIAALASDARKVDTARRKAKKLTEQALAAKHRADEMQAAFEEKLHEATSGAGNSHERGEQ